MTEEFRTTYCRHCANRRWDPELGVQCGMEPPPEVIDDQCAAFDLDEGEIIKNVVREAEAEEVDFVMGFEAWMGIASAVGLGIVIWLFFWNRTELEEDYRWTYAKAVRAKTEFVFKLPPRKGFLYSEYVVDGEVYTNRTEIPYLPDDEDEYDGLVYFLRYSTSNPGNSQIPDIYGFIPEYMRLEDFPERGIHRDSLKAFARQQLMKYQSKGMEK